MILVMVQNFCLRLGGLASGLGLWLGTGKGLGGSFGPTVAMTLCSICLNLFSYITQTLLKLYVDNNTFIHLTDNTAD